MGRVVLGTSEAIRGCLVGLLAGEHVLLEDVPGVGKTLLGKAVARSLSGSFTRLQFTPDLLPSDIIGGSVFHSSTGEFIFQRGPVFANIVMADEINRAPPRTQSALLEAMGEGQVSIDGVTHDLPSPFMVIATQNSAETYGIFPLPDSQLDRFLVRMSLGLPTAAQEVEILDRV
ncbi:MAG: AAA family ATPase, partial [Pirellulaceae bacterium]|nr:AAA family ATPase [Pirellulaceae bacterium]